ncbi:sugar nucleotide-binding protein [Lentibacillus amyloliquefaciens]|uniref:dTDP-4-dehydrorhamnose reductase n=1 Tax=Lentibacillus amyloliquefaciens TaxID=1472767 RepID=A0A0U3W9T4_9BACI|nr:sugar nucleotide-binding protein [Lentibacillus amyloliquefaciens]ALX49840.1 dTDP-4-dehydrorhamnose reductase [Lentibacillus amyloliquefaciens]
MKVCVFGASGYVGSSIYKLLKEDSAIDVTGTYLEDPAMFDDLNKLDINEPESFSEFYKQQEPDVVVWSVMSGPDEDELIQEGLQHIITHLTPQTKLVYVSTDFVFTEGKGPYAEDDPTSRMPDDHPLSTYANAKVKAEHFINRELLNYTILRAGPIYGENEIGQLDERTEKLLVPLRLKNTVAYRDDLVRTFVHVTDLAQAVIEFVKNDLTGTYHAGPDKSQSYYAFMVQMAEALGYHGDSVEQASEYEEVDKAIPKNTSLMTDKITNAIKQTFR